MCGDYAATTTPQHLQPCRMRKEKLDRSSINELVRPVVSSTSLSILGVRCISLRDPEPLRRITFIVLVQPYLPRILANKRLSTVYLPSHPQSLVLSDDVTHYRRDRAQREYEGFRMASEPDSLFFALSAEIRNNIYTLIFEHEDHPMIPHIYFAHR
jgi:hypothetical protein